MSSEREKKLEERVQELERELAQKEEDLSHFRSVIMKTNEQVEALIDQIQSEVQLAAKMQKALTPTEFPNISGVEFSTKFIAGTESGGDYFDIFEHEDRFRFGILLSSASGYSISALFLSVLLKLTGKIEARRGLQPDEVLQVMVEEMLPHLSEKDSASVFYAVVDRRSFEMQYASLGNTYALLQRAQGGRVEPLPATGPVFTRELTGPVGREKLNLNAKDRLVLCTPGLSETTNAEGETFGADSLLRALLGVRRGGVHDIRNEILFRLEEFTKGAEPLRDRTLLVTEVKERVIKLASTVE